MRILSLVGFCRVLSLLVLSLLVLSLLVLSTLAQPATSQSLDSLTQGYSEADCPSCVRWNEPQAPFKLHHNSYYVGTKGLGAVLITSADGHVLIDAALPNSAPLIIDNIRALGFDPADIKLILNSHVHYDHAGGIAAMQKVSGARVAASMESAPVLESGKSGPDDPQYGVLYDIPAVEHVERFTPGDTLYVGAIAVKSHHTAGHTPGGTSWSWESCDGDECLNLVYADSQTPVSAEGFRYTDSEAYPSAVADFVLGIQALEELPCDILVTTHPGASSLWVRLSRGKQNLVDSQACKNYAGAARLRLVARLKREAEESTNRN